MNTKLFSSAALTVITFTQAAFAQDFGISEYRIGILGGENESDRLASFECLKTRMEDKLGVPVSLYPAADYAGVIEGLLGGTLDYAELGASGYASIYLEDPEAVTPFATTVQTDGSSSYVSVMVARADSDIETLEDMEGKTLGFADPNSTSGYLVPAVALPQQGYPIQEFFGQTTFSGGHEQNILAVLNGDVDAGVTWASGVGEWEEGYTSGNLRSMVDKGLVDMNNLRLLWTSPDIPNGPLVYSNELPEAAVEAIKEATFSFPQEDPECFYEVMNGEFDDYLPVDKSFYDFVISMREETIEE